jgi:phage repressor protein C with HTH and peptisase S24 domain
MAPTGQQFMSMGNRVRAARLAANLTQAKLAELAGCKQADVFRIESGEVSHSKYLAPILKVLHIGETAVATVPVVGYVGAGGEMLAIDDHIKGDGIEEIDAPPGLLNGIALIVRGTSMEPKYSDGEVLFIEKTIYAIDSLIGENCFVQTADGHSYVKKLIYGSRPGTFTLISYNAPPIENVVLERVYPIAYTKPRYRNLK